MAAGSATSTSGLADSYLGLQAPVIERFSNLSRTVL